MKVFTDNKKSKFAWLAMGLLGLLLLAGCGGEKATINSSVGGSPPPPPAIVYDYYVDVVNGDDTFVGSAAKPFKTIMTAMGVALSGESVKVLPGLYDTANGETFPIMVPAGVVLIGDEANKGGGGTPTVVKGAATYVPAGSATTSLVLGGGSTVAGLKFEDLADGAQNVMVVLELTGDVVRNNTMWGPGSGLGVGVAIVGAASGGHNVLNNHMTNGLYYGLYDWVSSSESLAQGNLIDGGNLYGAYINNTATGLDLGGGALGSTGGNTIICSSFNDLSVLNGAAIKAQNNAFDDRDPTLEWTSTNAGVDIYVANGLGGVDTTGATMAAGNCPFPYDYYVNATVGNDANAGTMAAPLKTITRAMFMAVAGNYVKVLPGLYDIANGEANPIVVPASVSVIGNETNKGGGSTPTKFSGVDIQPGAGALIAGLWGDIPASSGFNLDTSGNIIIRNNTVTGGTYGIMMANGTASNIIHGNILRYNTQRGIMGNNSAGTGTRFEYNVITNNLIGFEFSGFVGDLGGGALGSPGGNNISCNTSSDFWTSVTGTILAQNNLWDHDPPVNTGTLGLGEDYFSLFNAATLDSTGGVIAPSPCP